MHNAFRSLAVKAVLFQFLGCILLFTMTISGMAEDAENSNIIANPGFESGNEKWEYGAANPGHGIDSVVFYNGKSAAFSQSDEDGYHGGWRQSVILEPNTVYHYSVWLKTEDTGKLRVNYLYAEGERIYRDKKNAMAGGVLEGSSDWTQYETTFSTTDWDMPKTVRLYPALFYNKGRVWIDNVSLRKAGDRDAFFKKSNAIPEIFCYTGEILPTPQKVEYGKEFLPIYKNDLSIAAVYCDKKSSGAMEKSAAGDFLEYFQKISKRKLPLLQDRAGIESSGPDTIISIGTRNGNDLNMELCREFGLDTILDKIPAEGYIIKIVKKNGRNILIAAGHDQTGTYYAVQSLKQLLKVEDDGASLLRVSIEDYPLFKVRAPCETTAKGVIKFNGFLKNNSAFCLIDPIAYWDEIKDKDMSKVIDAQKEASLRGQELILGISPLMVKDRTTVRNIGSSRKIVISDETQIDELIMAYRKAGLDAGYTRRILLKLDDYASGLGKENPPYYIITQPEDRKNFSSLGEAHATLVRKVYEKLKAIYPDIKMSVCPAYYWSSICKIKDNPDEKEGEGEKYLKELGKLPGEIEIWWSGPGVVSMKITKADIDYYSSLIGRKPALFDNWFCTYRPYHFQEYAPQYPEDIYKYLSGSVFINVLSKNGRYVKQMMASDYLWNPKGYNPQESLFRALRMLGVEFGRADIIEKAVEIRKVFKDIYMKAPAVFEETPGVFASFSSEELLDRSIAADVFDEKFMADFKRVMDDWNVLVSGGLDGILLAPWMCRCLDNAKSNLQKLKGEKLSPKSLSPLAVIDANSMKGGAGPAIYGYQSLPLDANWITCRSFGPASEMAAAFNIDSSQIGKEAFMLIHCQDCEKPGITPIEISLNDNIIFSGENAGGELSWKLWKLPFKGSMLQHGNNVLKIRNLEKDAAQTDKWFMVNEIKLYSHR